MLCRRRDFDLFSYGMQPPIFHPPGRADKRVVAGRAGAPLALMEKINNEKWMGDVNAHIMKLANDMPNFMRPTTIQCRIGHVTNV